MDKQRDITGVVLAGGQGRRMGGQDKGLVQLFDKPLYQHIIDKLQPQVEHLAISANRNIARYEQSGYPVWLDSIPDYAGPLAGFLSALEKSTTHWVFFTPCDTPFIPTNLVETLWNHRADFDAVYVNDGNRDHPTLCLINKKMITPLQRFLANGDKKLMLFLQSNNTKSIYINANKNAFINVNTLEDRQALEEQGKQ